MPGIDPVGTFVGGRGVRVQAVMNEIGDREKIDIVNWSDNNSEYIREALSPAEIQKVEIEGKKATVYVAKDQQSIAIGRIGQNVRLASELTGFEIDVEVEGRWAPPRDDLSFAEANAFSSPLRCFPGGNGRRLWDYSTNSSSRWRSDGGNQMPKMWNDF